MKRLYLLFILCCGTIISSAQTKHFSFMGVTINGNISTVFNNLVKEGFEPSEVMDWTVEGAACYIGGASITLLANYETKQVYGMAVHFNTPSNEAHNTIIHELHNYLEENYNIESLTCFTDDNNYYFPYRCTKNGAEGLFFFHSPSGKADWIELLVYDKTNYIQMVYNKYIHVPFEGIPIDGSTANFKNKMIAKGFQFAGNHMEEGEYGDADKYYMTFKGSYHGYKNSTINVFYYKANNRVYSVEVTVPRQTETTVTLAHTLASRIRKTFQELTTLPLELESFKYDYEKGIESYEINKTGLKMYNQPYVGYLSIEADVESHSVHITFLDKSSADREY